MLLNPYTLSFPPRHERTFREKYFADSLWQFRLAFFLVALLYALFGFLDSIIVPEYRKEFFFIRFAVVIPVLTSVIILSYFSFFKKVWQLLLLFSFMVGGIGIIIMLAQAPDNYAYYGGLMLVLFAGYFFIKLRFLMASIAGWSLLIIYNVAAIFFSDAAAELIINNNFFFIAANVIGMMAAYNIESLTRRDFYLNKKLDDRQLEITEANRNLEIKVKERTNQLQKAKERAEQSDKLKSAFLANMSHEIRTPMNGILGFAELLKEPLLSNEQQQKYVEIIEKSGERMLNIINDIVDISRIEAGLMDITLKESDVNEQLDYIYKFFNPQVKTKGMQLKPPVLLLTGKSVIVTDREKLFAILTNLVKNAIKYSNEGSVEFGCIEKQSKLEFFVRDTGIGIPRDRQHAIFERFIQADIEDRDARQGAGLGLAISKAYVEMLGGNIWVESEMDKGSVFYFTLPLNISTQY